jgi:hypothetical protein
MVADCWLLRRPECWASLFANLRDAHNYANFIALARPVINSAASVSNAAMLR